MNGVSIVTHLVGKLIKELYCKLGINSILLLVLIIEFLCMSLYYRERMNEVGTFTNQSFQAVSEPELVSAKDMPYDQDLDLHNNDCYKVMIQMDNLYAAASSQYPYFYYEDDSNGYILSPIDYYSDISSYDILPARTYFPAGTRVVLPCYTEAEPISGKTVPFVPYETLYSNHSLLLPDQKNNTLSITFP